MDLRLTAVMEARLRTSGFEEEVLDFSNPTGEGFESGGPGGGGGGGRGGGGGDGDGGGSRDSGWGGSRAHYEAAVRGGGAGAGGVEGGGEEPEEESDAPKWNNGAKCRVGHCMTQGNCTRGTAAESGGGGGGCGGAGSCLVGAAIQWECAPCLACSREVLLRADWVGRRRLTASKCVLKAPVVSPFEATTCRNAFRLWFQIQFAPLQLGHRSGQQREATQSGG